ncbi:MAG: hypothetical protein ACFE0O_10585 [Opitutales bacterium]
MLLPLKRSLLIGLLAGTLTLQPLVAIDDMGPIIKAQMVLGQVDRIIDKYEQVQALLDSGAIVMEVPEPRYDNEGEYLLPFDIDGEPTEWATKALNTKVGAKAGEMAADQAGKAIASKVPFGGMFAGAMKKKAKEIGAVSALGGWDAIRDSSSLSFDKLSDYSVYLHHEFGGEAEYEQALAAAMAIYPQLEKSHRRALDQAYQEARQAARAYEKEQQRLEREAGRAARKATEAATGSGD